MNRTGRFAFYGALGLVAELCFTAITHLAQRQQGRWGGHTSLWMFPVYGLTQPLYEPVHSALRARGAAWPWRAGAYSAGYLGVEYLSGRVLRRVAGRAPWDYSHARLHLHGLIRAEYVPLWAAAGLAMEPLHDRLAGR